MDIIELIIHGLPADLANATESDIVARFGEPTSRDMPSAPATTDSTDDPDDGPSNSVDPPGPILCYGSDDKPGGVLFSMNGSGRLRAMDVMADDDGTVHTSLDIRGLDFRDLTTDHLRQVFDQAQVQWTDFNKFAGSIETNGLTLWATNNGTILTFQDYVLHDATIRPPQAAPPVN